MIKRDPSLFLIDTGQDTGPKHKIKDNHGQSRTGGLTTFGTEDEFKPTLNNLFNGEKISVISCGSSYSLALTEKGNLYVCNCYGLIKRFGELKWNNVQLKDKKNIGVKAISSGRNHSVILLTTGYVYIFWNVSSSMNQGYTLEKLNDNKYTQIYAFNNLSLLVNTNDRIEVFESTEVDGIYEDEISPLEKNMSFQDAVLKYCNYPFTINPISFENFGKYNDFELKSEESSESKREEVQVQIKFEHKSDRLRKTMEKAFNNLIFSDLKIKIKRKEVKDLINYCPSDEANDGFDYILCNKWFVGENCKHLQKLIDEQMSRNKGNEIEITEYSYETYFQFIQYLYTDSIEVQNTDLLLEMLSLAHNYSEEELKSFLVTIIKSLINVENVCLFYSSAINNISFDLEEYCFEFMSKNMKSIIKTKEYLRMVGNHIKSFLSKLYSN